MRFAICTLIWSSAFGRCGTNKSNNEKRRSILTKGGWLQRELSLQATIFPFLADSSSIDKGIFLGLRRSNEKKHCRTVSHLRYSPSPSVRVLRNLVIIETLPPSIATYAAGGSPLKESPLCHKPQAAVGLRDASPAPKEAAVSFPRPPAMPSA